MEHSPQVTWYSTLYLLTQLEKTSQGLISFCPSLQVDITTEYTSKGLARNGGIIKLMICEDFSNTIVLCAAYSSTQVLVTGLKVEGEVGGIRTARRKSFGKGCIN